MKWKKLRSTKLFEHARISIFEDDVELPNGNQTKYIHFGKMHNAAMVLALNNKGEYLLQKEYSYPPDEILYQLPGGEIESGESPEAGAKREFAEEAELGGDFELLGWFYIHNRRTSQKMYVYQATNLFLAPASKDPEELFENHWVTFEEIDRLIRTNEIRNYTILSGWALYKAIRC